VSRFFRGFPDFVVGIFARDNTMRAIIRPRANEECKFRQISSRFAARACNSSKFSEN